VFSNRGRRTGCPAPLWLAEPGKFHSKNQGINSIFLPGIDRCGKSCRGTSFVIGFAARESDARNHDG
jgi:hypothetical protein